VASNTRLFVATVKLFFQSNEWALFNDLIFDLTNKKQQLTLAFEVIVHECHTFINQIPDKKTKLKLAESLRVVTEGKVNNSKFILN